MSISKCGRSRYWILVSRRDFWTIHSLYNFINYSNILHNGALSHTNSLSIYQHVFRCLRLDYVWCHSLISSKGIFAVWIIYGRFVHIGALSNSSAWLFFFVNVLLRIIWFFIFRFPHIIPCNCFFFHSSGNFNVRYILLVLFFSVTIL